MKVINLGRRQAVRHRFLVSHQKISGWLSKEFIWGVYETEVYNKSFFQPLINQYWKILDSKFFSQMKN